MGPASNASRAVAAASSLSVRNSASSVWGTSLLTQQLLQSVNQTRTDSVSLTPAPALRWRPRVRGRAESAVAAGPFSSSSVSCPLHASSPWSDLAGSSTSSISRRLTAAAAASSSSALGNASSTGVGSSGSARAVGGAVTPKMMSGLPERSSSSNSRGHQRPLMSTAAASGGGGDGGGAQQPHHTNRLATEESPYLLQHAHNPVDWYPWGEEAFARARAEDKPIFLSVGYATCHWCHVMERESFESEEVAELINRDFIAIKVDREERPDVDRVYMTYVQAVSGSGGWPMSVWMTPQLEPFYGGTYYPPQDRFIGQQLALPGFATVLRRISALWRTNRQELRDKAATTLVQLAEALKPEPPAPTAPATAPPPAPGTDAPPPQPISAAAFSPATLAGGLAGAAVDACAADLGRRYDGEWGGFGGPPKFPRPCEINVLLRAQMRMTESGDPLGGSRLRSMALFSLSAMAAGGMYDQLGGGFHRYSVDELWHVPHFEKMLYDNPQLAMSYISAFQLTGDAQYARVARGVLDYLLRDMTAPGGGLYSAEDADSLVPPAPAGSGAAGGAAEAVAAAPASPEAAAAPAVEGGAKREGAFYVWDHSEIMAVLGPELGQFFCTVYGIEKLGNCDRSERSDPHNEFERKNVPYLSVQPAAAAARLGLPYAGDAAEAERRLAAAREALHAARALRPRPSLDDKIVTAWNGTGIGAFAQASRALAAETQVERLFPSEGRPASAYLAASQRVAGFVRSQLWDEGRGRLRRSFCRGPSAVAGFADDYAALVSGLLDLYECGGGREWLEWAVQLQDAQDALFWDAETGGYYSTPDPASPDADPSIRIRIKDDYDGAEPTSSSIAASNLLRLADMLTQRPQPAAAATAATATAAAPTAAAVRLPYAEAAQATLAAFSARLSQAPLAVPQLCCAAHTYSKRPLRQVIVAGAANAADTSTLLDAVHAPYCPDKVVVVVDPTDAADMAFWAAANPAAHGMVASHFARQQQQQQQQAGASGAAGATVFICQNYTCQAPTSDPAKVRDMLGKQQLPPSPAQLKHFEVKL